MISRPRLPLFLACMLKRLGEPGNEAIIPFRFINVYIEKVLGLELGGMNGKNCVFCLVLSYRPVVIS